MPLGWIDFSKGERSKVLSVLDMLSEAGTLDELGIAPVRDGFANTFFPGTSTIQTRAKYFMIVPYALKDLEYSGESNPNRVLRALDEVERHCGERFLANGKDTEGIIGSRSLGQGKWVKRTPADIYWAGLRNYGIFTGGSLSLTEYVRAMCALKNQKETLTKLGNRNDNAEESESDDKDAGELFKMQFWKIPTYMQDWEENLDIQLTEAEGDFLKRQMIQAYPDSMMAYILKNDMVEVFESKSFLQLEGLIHLFPERVRDDYSLASSFSMFLYVIRTVYNIIVSVGKNPDANREWENMNPSLDEYADIDLEKIIERLQLYRNVFLCRFLQKTQEFMSRGDLEGLMTEIRRRERELKQNRAKTMHPGEFDPYTWYGGGVLDYRFGNAKIIIKDIFESEGLNVKSK
ncbi:hypothetical protein SAMN04487771_100325 [[Clostridium] aminophilum]|uniref:Uncharacterized protein n=1 Tax=[Clostridium] aminophilum TaxID=1526 RepID=A0A1I0AYJ6_9FIRM|nr:DUF6361 family protein [[Clostridium] aminophilum]SES99484.1 hypothetical protein SAMN04487771_100325 [[Clostridium] aminophilum]